jgi:hypothetical protein
VNLSPGHDLKARIAAAAKREASPTRKSARTAILLVVVAALLFATSLFFWLGGVRIGDPASGIPERPLTFVCATVVGWSAIALVATWLAFSRGSSMLGRRLPWLLGIAILTPALLFGWMLLWNAQFPETMAEYVNRPGLRCLAFTLAMAAWPLVALSYVRREKNPTYPAAAGAARGVAMGALAGIVVDLWCPIAGPAHVLVGHITPILVLMGLGAAAGRVITGIRSR